MATLIRCLVRKRKGVRPNWYQAGDSSMYPSYLAQEDDADEVKICAASARPIGIVGCPTYHDLNTAYTAGEKVPIWMRGCGVIIYVLHDDDTGATTLDRGTALVTDDANAGCVMIWTYGDASEATDSFENVIGTLEDEVTIDGDTATFVKCRMSI